MFWIQILPKLSVFPGRGHGQPERDDCQIHGQDCWRKQAGDQRDDPDQQGWQQYYVDEEVGGHSRRQKHVFIAAVSVVGVAHCVSALGRIDRDNCFSCLVSREEKEVAEKRAFGRLNNNRGSTRCGKQGKNQMTIYSGANVIKNK